MTTYGFNVTTPAGRAVEHILHRSSLNYWRGTGWDLREDGDTGGRTLIVHPALEAWCSGGEGALIALIGSLTSGPGLWLSVALDALDDPNRRVLAEAVAIAADVDLAVAS